MDPVANGAAAARAAALELVVAVAENDVIGRAQPAAVASAGGFAAFQIAHPRQARAHGPQDLPVHRQGAARQNQHRPFPVGGFRARRLRGREQSRAGEGRGGRAGRADGDRRGGTLPSMPAARRTHPPHAGPYTDRGRRYVFRRLARRAVERQFAASATKRTTGTRTPTASSRSSGPQAPALNRRAGAWPGFHAPRARNRRPRASRPARSIRSSSCA